DRGVRFLAKEGDLELETDHEHEDADADLSEKPERPERGRREHELRGVGPDPPEERRSEQDPGGDLTDHGGLAEALEGPAAGARRDDDDDHREEKAAQRVRGVLVKTGEEPGLGPGRRRRAGRELETLAEVEDRGDPRREERDGESVGES